MPVALITGASAGLGRALATELAGRGWDLIIDARTETRLDQVATELSTHTEVISIVGDVAEAAHRGQLAEAVARTGRLDLLVNNASSLGQTPLPPLAGADLDAIAATHRINALAPLALIQQLLPTLATSGGAILNISSDAAIEHYPGWGSYGSAKAALDHLTATLAAENPQLAIYSVDPGDLRTELHQAAFPGEDISDRPEPESAVPALLWLIGHRPPSGRYRASDLATDSAETDTAGTHDLHDQPSTEREYA